MTWLAWRTQRSLILSSAAAAMLVGAWLVVGGFAFHHSANAPLWTELDVVVLFALPCLAGLALGAPLVAEELDRGTVRLAWSQETGRGRWLARKLLVAGAVIVAVFASLAGLIPYGGPGCQGTFRSNWCSVSLGVGPGAWSVLRSAGGECSLRLRHDAGGRRPGGRRRRRSAPASRWRGCGTARRWR